MRYIRSMLFVPGSKPALMPKAAAGEADAVCLDLEDSVVTSEKEASRSHVVRGLQELDFGARVRILRINALETPYAYRDLVEVVEDAGDRIDLVMLPKAGGPQDILFVDRLLTQIEAYRGYTHRIGIEAQIESAQGFLYVREIAAASPRLEALIFGPGDFAASMGMPLAHIGEFDQYDEAYPGHRWHAVMQTIVAAARAYGLRCMDGPYAAYKDAEGLERACRIARGLGFDGKQCIHPSQVATVNAAFSPSPDEVRTASAVVAAYDAAVAAGQGAATHEGRMIDAVSLRMARTILGRDRKTRTP
jgi:citrate lyase subunit beta/citryl-CoA lyase